LIVAKPFNQLEIVIPNPELQGPAPADCLLLSTAGIKK